MKAQMKPPISNIVGNSTGFTGVHAFMAAESVAGFSPKILIAPGYPPARRRHC